MAETDNTDPQIAQILQELQELRAENERKTQELSDMQQQLLASQAGQIATTVPEHAGGPGTNVAPTWSQWEQELSRTGQLETQ